MWELRTGFGNIEGYLVDALHQDDFRKLLFDNIAQSTESKELKLVFHKGSHLIDKEEEEVGW